MSESPVAWLSTQDAARRAGMTSAWVRVQIEAGRLRATVYVTGRRRTYRIRSEDWARFLARYSRSTDAADWD